MNWVERKAIQREKDSKLFARVPETIVTSGEKGASLGALVGAQRMNIATAGFAQNGFQTIAGKQPILGSRF